MVGVSSLVSLSTILEDMVVSTSLLGVISVGLGLVTLPKDHEVHFSFKIGLDGAGSNEGHEPLVGAGGEVPQIKVFDNQKRLIGKSKARYMCKDGTDHCVRIIKDVHEQPSYALLIGQRNPICIAAATVRYPGGDMYGWTGNWAKTCKQQWYYSDIDAQVQNGTTKLLCAWVGKSGYKDDFATAIQIHWPEFGEGFTGNGKDDQYYCKKDNTALSFFRHSGPWGFNGITKNDHKVKEKGEKEREKHIKKMKKLAEEALKKKKKKDKHKVKTPGRDTRSIRSHFDGHSAKHLCESDTSAGPSLVSLPERTFCHMPDKVLYKFCEDVPLGVCWNHTAHAFAFTGNLSIHARAAMPDIQFPQPLVWGKGGE